MDSKDEFGLLPIQRKFADLYLSGMPAARALREAGYRNHETARGAHRMLQRKDIRAYVRLQREKLAEKAGIEREHVVNWLILVMLTPVGRAGEHHRELLESDYQHTYTDGRTTRRIRMVNKMAAVRLLCHIMGWTRPEQRESQINAKHSELAEMIRRARAGER